MRSPLLEKLRTLHRRIIRLSFRNSFRSSDSDKSTSFKLGALLTYLSIVMFSNMDRNSVRILGNNLKSNHVGGHASPRRLDVLFLNVMRVGILCELQTRYKHYEQRNQRFLFNW